MATQDPKERIAQLEHELEDLRNRLSDCEQRSQDEADRYRQELEDCEQRAAAGGEPRVTYDVALASGAIAYRRAFDGLAVAAAGGLHAFDEVAAAMRRGRLTIHDHEPENPFGVVFIAEQFGMTRGVARMAADLEPLVFDRRTGLPKLIALLRDSVKAYADDVCACEGEEIWAEAALRSVLLDLRDVLVDDWTAMAHVHANGMWALRQGLDNFVALLPTCPPAGAVGGPVETIALWAGEHATVARRLERWYVRSTAAVDVALEVIQADDPGRDRLLELARHVAVLTATPSPVRLPLVVEERGRAATPIAATRAPAPMVHAATTTRRHGH